MTRTQRWKRFSLTGPRTPAAVGRMSRPARPHFRRFLLNAPASVSSTRGAKRSVYGAKIGGITRFVKARYLDCNSGLIACERGAHTRRRLSSWPLLRANASVP